MKKANRILLGLGFTVLLLAAWAVAATAETPTQKQAELIAQAEEQISYECYAVAVPLLEEAIGYNGKHTAEAEARLKAVYIELMGTKGISKKYLALLDMQMSRADATPEVFTEAASYYISANKLPDALNVLKTGIAKLNSQELVDLYESQRYAFKQNRVVYEEVTAIINDSIQVRQDGLWGIAGSTGSIIIPCVYDQISNYSNSRVIVKKENQIYAVNTSNNRIALLQESATDIANYGNDRVAIKTNEGWKRATGSFAVGSAVFEEIGMYSNGYAAAKQNGKWGVIGTGTEWLIPAEYDEIILDELGRCYGQGAVFVRKGQSVNLFAGGELLAEAYEDAKPFNASGWAAVKKNGMWGFIDTSGAFMIDPAFGDALSFSGHLAAVEQNGLWGYVALTGSMAIEPQFLGAKSFLNGNAPILTERGWQFISLVEYQKGVSL